MAEQEDVSKHIISLLVNNQPGVLIRIALVFARRSYNIDSLVTHATHDARFSIINITATGKEKTLKQIIKSLNKLVDVIHVTDTSNVLAVQLELLLMKIKLTKENRAEVLQIVKSLDCNVMDIGIDYLIIRYISDENNLNAIEEIMEVYGIIEIIRTGTILMKRGAQRTA